MQSCRWGRLGNNLAKISVAAQRVLDSIEWIEIPAGEFLMGSSPEEIASLASEANFRGAMVDRHTFEAGITHIMWFCKPMVFLGTK